MKTYKVTVDSDKTIRWYNEAGQFDREDGPAIEYSSGGKVWYINGKYHREDGPAIEYSDGYKAWYINGKYHREDGPAIEYPGGAKSWYLEGKALTEAEFNLKMNPTSCEGKQVVIDGKTYVLQKVKK